MSIWSKFNRNQKIVLGLLASLLILGPVSTVISVQNAQIAELFPATPPITPPVEENFGYAIKFTNRATSAIYTNPIIPLDTFTFEAWINPNPFPDNTVERYIFAETSNGSGQEISLNLSGNNQYNNGYGSLVAYYYDSSGPHTLRTNFVVKPNIWHQIALVKSATNIYILIDGTIAAAAASNNPLTLFSPNPLVIGNYSHMQPTQTKQFFGIIDEVRISNIARYELNNNYAVLMQPFVSDANTLALYPYDSNIQDTSSYHQSTNIYGSVDFVVSTIGQPTASPSPTPSASPSLWPQSSPFSSPSTPPVPSATPVPNQQPVITTTELPAARQFTPYTARITGIDTDQNNKLSLKISNLPLGLAVTTCRQTISQGNKKISCLIKGRPVIFNRQAKTYNVKIILTDYQGGNSQKILPLTVIPNSK